MEAKVVQLLGIKNLDNEKQRAVYYVLANIPDDASEDEIQAVIDDMPEMYKSLLDNQDEEEDIVEDDAVPTEENDIFQEYETMYTEKAKKALDFLLEKEKDLLSLKVKPEKKALLAKAIQALTKEAEKLAKWEEKENTIEAYKTSLSDLYDVENPEDYYNRKKGLYTEYVVLVQKQVDDNLPKWKSVLSKHRQTAQNLLT